MTKETVMNLRECVDPDSDEFISSKIPYHAFEGPDIIGAGQ